MADDRRDGSEFDRLHDKFTVAFENEDNDALTRFFAPTAVMIGPGGNLLSGRDAVIAFLQRVQRIQSVRFDATDTRRVTEDVVRQAGGLTLTVRGQGRETRTIAGAFFMLWTRGDAGWQIESCVWSRRPVNQGGQAGGRGMGGRGMGGGGGRGMGGGNMGGGGGRGMGGGGRGMGGGNMGGGGGRGMGGGGRGMGGRGMGGRRGGDGADESSDAGEGGAVARRDGRPSRDGEGAFNPRNLHRDDAAPLIPRLD